MIATLHPSHISGSVIVPASKSVMQRACALALLNNGQTILHHPGKSKDDLTAINIIQQFGAEVKYINDSLVIKSEGQLHPATEINCGESGLAFRMFAAIASLLPVEVILNGEGSLLERPMHFIDKLFPQLSVKTRSANGFLPYRVQGPLEPEDISIDGSESSQYLTGLLFAFAKAGTKRLTISVSNLKSRPYADLSIKMLEHFGYKVKHENHEHFYIEPVLSSHRQIEFTIEGDWSSASFLMVAGAIAGAVTVKGLDCNSAQADKAISNVLRSTGATVNEESTSIHVAGNANGLMAFNFDATDCPDLFPPLVALAVNCKGVSTIKGVSRLANKESNRALSLLDVFGKMGAFISIHEDDMIINGSKELKAAEVSSHNDHRIAMAAAIAALKAGGPVLIKNAEAVAKSYPGFFEGLEMLGASLSLSSE